MKNPFPGPQPYRADDRNRFFGRDDLSYRLRAAILAYRCVTVYGPSGAGKSSLLQASVFPQLIDEHDIRVLRIDAWPESEEPIRWLARAMYEAIGLGDVPADIEARDAVFRAANGATRGSSRLFIIHLDQLEQLLFSSRSSLETTPFFECLEELLDKPLRMLHVVISLREDYLGRFRSRLQDMERMTEHGFRVGPFSVAELTEAVVASAAVGDPGQTWSSAEMGQLMMQVRVPGQAATEDAEAQSAYAQIICRALFHERAQEKTVEVATAETILRGYLESTLAALGPLRQAAQELLEDHLVSADGSRTLRTEKELAQLAQSSEIESICKHLEQSAILRAEEHHGSRYFEIGHDWLARRVFEGRKAREQEKAIMRERQAAQARFVKMRRHRLIFAVTAIMAGAFAVWAKKQEMRAQAETREAQALRVEAEAQRAMAERQALNSRNAMRIAIARQLRESSPTAALSLLREIEPAEIPRAWEAVTLGTLNQGIAEHVFKTEALVVAMEPSVDGKYLFLSMRNNSIMKWKTDGTEAPVLQKTPAGVFISTAFNRFSARSSDKLSIQVWDPLGNRDPFVLLPHHGIPLSMAFSPNHERLAVAFLDHAIKVFYVDESHSPLVLHGNDEMPVRQIVWSPDGERILSVDARDRVFVWSLNDKKPPIEIRSAEHKIGTAAWSPDGKRLVLPGLQGVNLANADGTGESIVIHDEHAPATAAAFSPDGKRIATGSEDGTVVIRNADGTGDLLTRTSSGGAVTSIVWRPDNERVYASQYDGNVRVWRGPANSSSREPRNDQGRVFSPDGKRFLTLSGKEIHIGGMEKPVHLKLGIEFRTAEWSPDGRRIVTTADDFIVRVWNAQTEEKPFEFRGHLAQVNHASFSPDGAFVVSSSDDMRVLLWNTNESGPVAEFDGHMAPVQWAVFSADGKRIASASSDATVRIWNADHTGNPVVLADHEKPVMSVAWSPDHQRIASASLDGTVRIWSADGAGAPIVFRASGAPLTHVTWSSNGHRIVASLMDKTIRVWEDLEPPRGVDDPRLWTATTYCMPPDMRQTLGFTEEQSQKDLVLCEKRIAKAWNWQQGDP